MLDSPNHITSPDWTSRSFFSLARDPALLKIAHIDLSDNDVYVCSIFYADGTVLNHSISFTVIRECPA